MRILITIVILTVVSIMNLNAQRLLPGQKGIEVSTGMLAGKVNQNYFVNLALTVQSKHGNYWIWAGEYTKQNSMYKNWQLPIESYTGEIGYIFNFLSDPQKVISLNGGLMAIGGYETINHGSTALQDGGVILNKDSFIYGVGGRLSLETYLSDRFVILVQGRAKAFWGTDLKELRPSAGIGLRLNF
ncbi:conjugal transfer protein TraO [Sphingobacterium sp.]|uniref:conjugal transfer protein TraO n=1 Tax=Sphingobacterium sp. TaxID=341027 RepID=UPI002586C7E8|nr:conjugal transfer protein TraO [Sphingobacterium sp.]WET69067.1 MAG: conjugal transfer protein TraO [Sphingobacterium sp.]